MKLKFVLLGLVAGLALTVVANPDADTDAVLDFDDFDGDEGVDEYDGDGSLDEYDDEEDSGVVARGINPISGLPVPKGHGKHKHHHKKPHKHGHKKGKHGHKHHLKNHHHGFLTQHDCQGGDGDLCGPTPYGIRHKANSFHKHKHHGH